ncbi:MAG: caspase family protein [Candidatus Accumulibacter phosphatis]|nr:caspase family protein [Candidatus Accumulibacter phosphatis]
MSRRFENAYALLIAVDQNLEAAAALPAVAADARALYDVLVHPQRCAYRPDNIRLLSGAESTRQAILAGLDWLAERLAAAADGNATAIVYFSGHGHVEDGEHFLIPYDFQRRRMRSSALAAADFAADVAALAPRRLLVLLDCCHAGGDGGQGYADRHSTAQRGAAADALPARREVARRATRRGRGPRRAQFVPAGAALLPARGRPHEHLHLSPDRGAERARAAGRRRDRGAGFRPDQSPPALRAGERPRRPRGGANAVAGVARQLSGGAASRWKGTRQRTAAARPAGAAGVSDCFLPRQAARQRRHRPGRRRHGARQGRRFHRRQAAPPRRHGNDAPSGGHGGRRRPAARPVVDQGIACPPGRTRFRFPRRWRRAGHFSAAWRRAAPGQQTHIR